MVQKSDSNEKRFNKIDKKLDRVIDVVTTISERVDKIDEKLETKADKKDLEDIYNLLDKIAKQQELDGDERIMIGHHLERLDRWVHELADKIDYKLTS